MAAGKKDRETSPTGVGSELPESSGTDSLWHWIRSTPANQQGQVTDIIKVLTDVLSSDDALQGSPDDLKRPRLFLDKLAARVEDRLSEDVAEILHHSAFQKLEGSWRGVQSLLDSHRGTAPVEVSLLDITKEELQEDFLNDSSVERSLLYKRVFSEGLDTPNSTPFGAMVGDCDFAPTVADLTLLRSIGKVAAIAHCPFLTAASPRMISSDSWAEEGRFDGLANMYNTSSSPARSNKLFRELRESADSSYLVLTMPRVIARAPYECRRGSWRFHEFPRYEDGAYREPPHEQFCWMNAAWALAGRLAAAFEDAGISVAIRGRNSGGAVEELPTFVYRDDSGAEVIKPPSEVVITNSMSGEFAEMGLMSLDWWHNSSASVFVGAQTLRKASEFVDPNKTADDRIATSLPYVMVASRIGHALHSRAVNMIGSSMEASDVQKKLAEWINQYVSADDHPSEDEKRRKPLKEAEVSVTERVDRPGWYYIEVKLRPWLQVEQLHSTLRLATEVRGSKGR